MPAKINILMTGGGAPGAPGILKCLGKEKQFNVIVADANEFAVGKHLGNDFETIPPAMAPLFAESVLDLCKKKNVNILLSLVTKELQVFAQHKEQFNEAGIQIPLSDAASLEIANNKSKLYEFLQWRGIAVPDFHVVETTEQFRDAIVALGYPEKAVCFKPSVSNGSRGFRIISEQMNELDLLFNHKPASTYITLQDAMRILSTGKFPELLLSEYLPGEEYSVDCLANHGETVIALPRLRKKMINGISVEGAFVKEAAIIEYCTSIIKELRLHGNIGIQVKRSNAGNYLILEINPRVQGSISAGLGAGINLPVLAVKQELGMTISPKELNVSWGTQFSRYWDEVFW